MTAQARLEYLGLAPRWRRKPAAGSVCRVIRLAAVGPGLAEGKAGWLLLDALPEGAPAQLLDHVLLAFGLQRMEDFVFDLSQAESVLQQGGPDWLWLAGLRSEVAFAQDRKVLRSPSLPSLSGDGQAKSRLWQDWCGLGWSD